MENSNLPAFQPSVTGTVNFHYGLTKREYFAGLFIQGELSGNSKEWANEKDLVQRGLLIADELLKQLEQ
jgi:hypothetical protein